MKRCLAIAAFVVLFGTAAVAAEPEVSPLAGLAQAIQAKDPARIEAAAAAALPSVRGGTPEDHARICLAVADALVESGRPQAALRWARCALEPVVEDRPAVARRAADIATKAGDPSLARQWLGEALRAETLELGEDDTSRRFTLLARAEVATAVGETTQARADATEAQSLSDVQAELEQSTSALGGQPVVRGAATHEMVRVFYATQRRAQGDPRRDPERYFTADRGPMRYGEVWVRTRVDSIMGPAARWGVLSLVLPSPRRRVVLDGMTPYADGAAFLAKVRRAVDGSERREVLVFVHGYNQSFADAAKAAAALATDLEIDGAPILYSWPSQDSPISYVVDANLADQQVFIEGLSRLLLDISRQSGATRVHIVGHSMGNRFLLKALQAAQAATRGPGQRPIADQIVFASPDVDAQDFADRIRGLRGFARGMTLYASDRDAALLFSQTANRFPRAGQAQARVSLPGLIEAIDTTDAGGPDLLRHGDFGGSARDDLRGVLWLGLPPGRRCLLRPGPAPATWVFAPSSACGRAEFRYAIWLIRRAGDSQRALAEADRTIRLLEDQVRGPDRADQSLENSLAIYRGTRRVLARMAGGPGR